MNPVRAVLCAPVVQLALTKVGQFGCRHRDEHPVKFRGRWFLRCPDCGRETQGIEAHEPTT